MRRKACDAIRTSLSACLSTGVVDTAHRHAEIDARVKRFRWSISDQTCCDACVARGAASCAHRCPQACPQGVWIVASRMCGCSMARCRIRHASQTFFVVNFSPNPLQCLRRKGCSIVSTSMSAGLSTRDVDRRIRCARRQFAARIRGRRNGRFRQAKYVAIFWPDLRRAPSLRRMRPLPTSLSAGLSTGCVDSLRGMVKISPNTRRALSRLGCDGLSTALPQWFSTPCVESRHSPDRRAVRGYARHAASSTPPSTCPPTRVPSRLP